MRVDLQAFLDQELVLPYGGKDYVVRSPDARTGLSLQNMLTLVRRVASGRQVSDRDVAALDLDDEEERNLYQQVLGPAYDEMLADRIPFTALKGMALYAWGHFSESAATGRLLAESAVSGEAGAPNRKARRARKSSPGSSGSGRSTPALDSTSSTSSETPAAV